MNNFGRDVDLDTVDIGERVHLVTGAAGFIGFHLSQKLIAQGETVVGVDNFNDYYDVDLKEARAQLLQHDRFDLLRGDLGDQDFIFDVFERYRPSHVVNLAAQAGVRYSVENPAVYIQSNVVGFFHILEACRRNPVQHLVYASSSSVYGGSDKVPFDESDKVAEPVSLYAATKLADEVMAHAYSHLYGIPATGLRFFTVYGPWGRPDMAYFSFLDRHFAGEEITIYNDGDFEKDLSRDFTYIDDIVEGISRTLVRPPQGSSPHALYNIGNHQPVKLMTFIETLERCLSRSLGQTVSFRKVFEPLKPGDVPSTYAATNRLREAVGFEPSTPLATGLQRFTDWYVTHRDHLAPGQNQL